MLTNDTWFMYEASKTDMIGADGFGSLNATGDNITDLNAIKQSCYDQFKDNECQKWQKGLLKGKYKKPVLCPVILENCLKARIKEIGQLEAIKQTQITTKQMENDLASSTSPSSTAVVMAGMGTALPQDDNTMMYVAIGGGILLLAGAAFFVFRNKAVPVTK